MKTFYVWTHREIKPLEVNAATRADAIKSALVIVEEDPPKVPGGYFGAEFAGSDGPAWIPSRPAIPLETPFARVKPKPSTFHR